MFVRTLCLVLCFITVVDCWCTPFTYGDWREWSSCSRSCAGGERKRVRYSCVKDDEDWQSEDCNEFCYNGGTYWSSYCTCSNWRSGTCCQDCKAIDIPHCKSGQHQCGGSPDNVRCNECLRPYYAAGWGYGCHECPTIAQCTDRHCTNKYDTRCDKCEYNGILFKPTPRKTECERVCASDRQNCWPGECEDGLTRKCVCALGFHKHSGPGETSCQLDETNTPSVTKCFTSIFAQSGKGKQTRQSNCADVKDFYGNFQPQQIHYDLTTYFRIDIKNVTNKTFIKESKFGVTDVTIYVSRELVTGTRHAVLRKELLTDNSLDVNETFFENDSFELNIALQDGERLCTTYEAKGGGYLKTIDIRNVHTEKGPYVYRKTKSSQSVCYRYDGSSPKHCSITKNCSVAHNKPLEISKTITRVRNISVNFNEWYDPKPLYGKTEHASGIESYLITVHEVSDGMVDSTPIIEKSMNVSNMRTYISLPSISPRLYCIKLEVKDVAENIQQARRFVLYDKNSTISVNHTKGSFKVTSAREGKIKHAWQTNHGKICIQWKSYFINTEYDKSYLAPLKQDSHISAEYDQTTGPLPVSGTENVYGIIGYWFSSSLNSGTSTKEIPVPDFTNQSLCKSFNLNDGETYNLTIRAVDIVNNTFNDSRVVHIDRSPPHVHDIGLMKNGIKHLFVHDQIDLAKMNMSFAALDPHSGILNIEWWIGVSDSGSELGHGTEKPNKQDGCSKGSQKCYCPDIGKCELYTYYISMNKLISNKTNVGKHNRNYFFTVKVTNNAGLSNIEHFDLLVDDSPPQTGVIYEGPYGSPDIDYTSESSFIVRWHGFIDHESGIKEYRLGLSDICVNKYELVNPDLKSNITQFKILPYKEFTFRMNANFTGKKYVNIIAINNAMEASDVVCSDGITRDDTPPDLKNVRLENGKWSESLYCANGNAWLFQSSMRKVKMPNTTSCHLRCMKDHSDFDIFDIIPFSTEYNTDTNVGDFLCERLPIYKADNVISLPDNHIFLTWDREETGSQIEDYFVSFGLHSENDTISSNMNYKSTNAKRTIKMRHIGVGNGINFYSFIKSVNKANIEKITVIGPIVIDETPPIFNKKPVVNLGKNAVTIGWNKSTVYDLEQKGPINQVFFQIVHDSDVVTPPFEWRLEDNRPCENFTGGCLTYPLTRLQKIDTDLGLNFIVKMYAYNNAGHVATEETEPFKIQSRYPPGHAIVKDVDPEVHPKEKGRDVNVHFTANKLCSAWNGFKHHEHVVVEVGVGDRNETTNVVPYQPVNDSNHACVESNSITLNKIYFIFLRASCSGGETISVSNGVKILNERKFKENFHINIGKLPPLIKWIPQLTQNASQETFCASISLEIGHRSTLIIKGFGQNTFVTENHDIIIVGKEEFNNSITLNVTAVSDRNQCITLRSNDLNNVTIVANNGKDKKIEYIRERKTIQVTWQIEGNNEILSQFTYKIALGEWHEDTQDKYSLISDWTRSDRFYSHDIHTEHLLQSKQYTLIVKVCTPNRCIGPITSKPFEIENAIEPGRILSFKIDLNNDNACIDVNMEWGMFKAKSNVTLYQWSVGTDKEANDILTKWHSVHSNGKSRYKVTSCMNLPVLVHTTLYLCVRAFSTVGNKRTTCKHALIVDKGEFDRTTLYDLDASVNSWNTIKEMIHSSNIGRNYELLHNAEMDFGNTNTQVVGTLMYATERKVTWFLMKQRHLPDFNQCEGDSECIYTKQTETGFVLFDNNVVKKNTFYYTCAFSNASSVSRELFTETLSEIRVCSNGFIVDDTPPFGGEVIVENKAGYITTRRELEITWNGFDDNVDTTQLGYIDRIRFYYCAVGTRPGNEDIYQYTNVGNTIQAVISNLDLVDGSVVYVSVKATDHAGLSHVVSSKELTIDASTPVSGKINIYGNSGYISSTTIEVILSDFKDDQSGIEYFNLAVGSGEYLEDVLADVRYFTDHIKLELPDNMQDGHKYYVKAKAVNRAGLSSSTVIAVIIPDRSGPTGGHVLDGDWRMNRDQDFQKEMGYIKGHWKGFMDPHSDVRYYRVGLGTKRYYDDIEAMLDVGLHTDIAWNNTYATGKKYYVTVEACNGASLCRSISSDGILLDNSPPINGIVKVGSSLQHQKYVPTGSSVHIGWAGYEDPESGIDHYEYCLGSKPLSCDVIPFSSCLLQSNIVKTGLNLTHDKTYYASVKGTNKAGMSVSTVSDAFTVDTSPSEIIQKPSFNLDHSSISGLEAQWDRSVLKISWKFIDIESKVSSHVVTLKTHHEGHTPVEHVHVGHVDSLTISLDEKNWLHNGDKYFVIVTSCNTAGLCSTSQSDDLLIDSSPPHQGGFKPPMTWHNFRDSYNLSRSRIELTWYGFVDAESSIDTYYLSVSRSYSGSELSNGTISSSEEKYLDEQNTSIILSEALWSDELLILTLWARNKAGLNSSVERITVTVLASNKVMLQDASGILEIQKHSCDVHYCNKDCTCAVVGNPCVDVHLNDQCTTLNETDVQIMNMPVVDVFGGLDGNHRNITASSACLSAHWVLRGDPSAIQRYEWSMGFIGQPGDGVFDKSEIPWKDVGKQVEIVHCLSISSGLQHNNDYQVFVRAWYAWDTFADFVSPPIRIDHTSPHHAKGKYIKDTDITCKHDFDVIDWMDSITACWDKVFYEKQGRIMFYTLSLGTTINGSDIYEVTNVGLVTNITLTNIKLSHGTRYFFTVTAYNDIGLHTTLSSDGFLIDIDTPIKGVVFNTDKHQDSAFQSSITSFGISWHGFVDHHSGVKTYFVAIVDNDVISFENVSFVDVHLKNKHTFKDVELQHGHSYKGLVKAVDKAGHTTDVVSSIPKFIDVTAPKSFDCGKYQKENISINETISSINNTISFSGNMSMNNDYIIEGILTGSSSSIKPILSFGRKRIILPITVNNNNTIEFQYEFVSKNLGIQFFTISGFESATLDKNYSVDLKMLKCIRLTNTVHSRGVTVTQIGSSKLAVKVNIVDEQSLLYKVKVGMGTSPGGFQISPFTVIHGCSIRYFDVDVRHGSHIYATVIAENHAGLTSVFKSEPIIMDKTPPLITQIESKLIVGNLNANYSKPAFQFETKWAVIDQESDVKYCLCRLGKHIDPENIEGFTLSDTINSCILKTLDLQHGSTIFVIVKCINNVELVTETMSEEITVSVDDPDSTFANVHFISTDNIINKDLRQNINKTDLPFHVASIQTDHSRLLFEYTGFEDASGINYYEYRLMCNNDTVINWNTNGKHTVADINSFDLQSGRIYTAEVRAINSGLHASIPVSADILVQNEEPRLTGHPLSVTRRNENVVFDWSQVFQIVKDISVTYDVTVGSKAGYSDILELKNTAVKMYVVIIPQTTIISHDIGEVFISVTCTYSTGLFTVYHHNYRL